MKRLLFAAAALALFACAPVSYAQPITYEPGNEPPADIWGPIQTHQRPADPGPPQVAIIDVEMDHPTLTPRPPVLQRAHSGVYQDLGGSGAQIDYRHLSNGVGVVKVLLFDGRWGEGSGPVTGAQAIFDLYADGEVVGEVKVGSTTVGAPCGRLKARARFGAKLLFPADPNPANCLPAPLAQGQIAPPGPYSYCWVQLFGEKLGEVGAGPETCVQR